MILATSYLQLDTFNLIISEGYSLSYVQNLIIATRHLQSETAIELAVGSSTNYLKTMLRRTSGLS